MALGMIGSVSYVDPWGTMPSQTFQTGVVVKTTSNPAGTFLAAVLVQGSTQLYSTVGSSNSLVRILPTQPLSPELPYNVWLQWVPQGTQPQWPATPNANILVASLVLPIPKITSLGVSATTVTGTWDFGNGAGGTSGANLQIFNSAGVSAGYLTTAGPSGQKAITLPSSGTYQAYIQSVQPALPQPAGGFTAPYAFGPWSAPISVSTYQPQLTALAYDGQTLTATWTPIPALPAGFPLPASIRYGIQLVDGAGDVLARFDGSPNGTVAAVGTLQGAPVTVQPYVQLGPVSLAPTGGAQPITGTPGITNVSMFVNAGKYGITATLATPSGLPGGTTATLALFEDGVLNASAPATGSPLTASVAVTPKPGSTYVLRAYLSAPAAGGAPALTGPLSPPVALVMNVPSQVTATYDGTNVYVSWTGGGANVVAHAVTLTSGGTTYNLTTGPETYLQAALPLGLSAQWQATVQPLGAGAPGVAAAAVKVALPVWTSPAITRLAYDGKTLNAAWTAAAQTGVGYVLTVSSGGTAIATQNAGPGLAASLPLELAPGTAYTATVQAIIGTQATPASAPATLMTATPAVSSVTTDPQTGALNVQWTGVTNGTGYALTASVGGTIVYQATGLTASPTAVPALPHGGPAAIALTAVRNASGLEALGPASPAFWVPNQAPELLAATYDGTNLALSWGAVPNVSGYTVSVLQAGAASPFITKTAPAGTSPVCQFTLQPGIADLTKAYAVVVQGTVTNGSGPASAALPVFLGAPALGHATFDGAKLEIPVTTAPTTAPGSYVLTFSCGGKAIAQRVVPAPAAGDPIRLFPDLPVDASQRYDVLVQGEIELANGATSLGQGTSTSLSLAAPAVASATYGATLDAVLSGGAMPTTDLALQAVLYTDGVAGTPVTADATGKVSFTVSGTHAYAVAAQALVASAAGPWSDPVPVPSTTPAVTAAYSGSQLALSWTGSAAGRYQVVATAGTTTVQSLVTGLEATLPLAVPAGTTTASVTVTPVTDVATGPVGTLALVAVGGAITSASTAANRTATIAFQPPAGATQVVPVLSWGGRETPLAAQAATSPLSVTLPAAAPNGAALALQGVTASATGPVGPAVAMLTAAPTGLLVSYDGADVTATWDAGEGSIDGYWAVLTVKGTPTTLPNSAVPSLTHAYAGADPATLAVGFTSGVATGPACVAIPVILGQPGVSSASVQGNAVTLAWSAATDTGVTAYEVVAGADQVLGTFATTSGTVTLPPGGGAIAVRAVGTNTRGPLGTPATPFTTAPAVAPVAYDLTGAVSAGWPAVTGATAYRVVIMGGGAIVSDATYTPADPTKPVTYAIPASVLTDDLDYTLSAAALTTAAPTLTGPLSAPVRIPSTPPMGVTASYDGATARVSWSAVPGASGYRVSVTSNGTSTKLGDTSATSASYALSSPADGAILAVQALVSGAAGAPSASVPVFSQGLFLSPGGTTAGPYIALARNGGLAASAIVLDLPNLFPVGLPTGTLPATAPFVLSPYANAPFAYQLTIAADSPAWTFDGSPIRGTLVTAYQGFLKTLQGTGFTAQPAGIAALREAISRAMPQTFQETLYYAYGARFDQGYFDLRPGMVLRVEYESYQSLGAAADARFLSGFVTAGVADYEVATYTSGANGSWLTGLDAFLGGLAAAQGVTVTPASPEGTKYYGGGGALDGFFAQFQQPFCRVVYPQAFLPNNSAGSPYPNLNPVLLAASSLDDLETATANVRANLPPGGSVASFYMRGRAVFRPMIRVTVNGTPRLVAIGTTVGNVLASAGARPPAVGGPSSGTTPVTGLRLAGVSLSRATGCAILAGTAAPTSFTAGGSWPVRLDWTPAASYGPFTDWLDLPLLHGDRLTFQEP